jgi:hypothetical protein
VPDEVDDCDAGATSSKDAQAAETFRYAAEVWRELAAEWAALHKATLIRRAVRHSKKLTGSSSV